MLHTAPLTSLFSALHRVRRGRTSLAWAAAASIALAGLGTAHADEPSIEMSVQGDVQSVQAQWRGGLIVSHVTVGVRSCRRGTCPDAVEMDMVGGELDGIHQQLSEHAVPRVGESIEADLSRNRHGTLRPVGHLVIRRLSSP